MSELLKDIAAEEVKRIENDLEAEKCLNDIRDMQNQKAFWKEYYEEQYRKVCESCDAAIGDAEVRLRHYFETVPHKQTKTQESYALPSGKLVVKQQEPEYSRDDERIIEWLKENGGERYVKVRESLDWAALKKTLTVLDGIAADENGEVIPGIAVTEREPVFKVELK